MFSLFHKPATLFSPFYKRATNWTPTFISRHIHPPVEWLYTFRYTFIVFVFSFVWCIFLAVQDRFLCFVFVVFLLLIFICFLVFSWESEKELLTNRTGGEVRSAKSAISCRPARPSILSSSQTDFRIAWRNSFERILWICSGHKTIHQMRVSVDVRIQTEYVSKWKNLDQSLAYLVCMWRNI